MGRHLFDMSESELDREVQAHYDRMYRDAYEYEYEPCCKYCDHYYGCQCSLDEEDHDDDDYCDEYKERERDCEGW